jgi:arabinofuranosyltransferase
MKWLDETRMKYPSVFFALALMSLAFLKTAWVSDDAYITFRSIDNFLSGYGLRWNIDERVMVFTHPLWMLLLTPFIALTRNDFAVALTLSYLLTMFSVWILCVKVAQTNWGRLFAGIALASSLSFVTYSSSGLEGPLLHCLAAVAIWRLSTGSREAKREGRFWGFWLALSFLARPDAVLIFFPMAIHASRQCQSGNWRMFVKGAFVGLLPAMAWTLFATIYFGSPFPNTFYAKVMTGIAYSENIKQGFWYLYETAVRDPAGAVLIIGATLAGLLHSRRWTKPLAFSVLIQCAYLVWIGGDFMAGRFTSVLVILSVGSLLSYEENRPAFSKALMALACAGLLGMAALHKASILIPPDYFDRSGFNGVQDEWGAHYRTNGLLGSNRNTGDASSPLYQMGAAALVLMKERMPAYQRMQGIIGTTLLCAVGQFGKAAGPHIRIIDPLGITDPFLSHLPGRKWIPGHIVRPLPSGYAEAIVLGDSSKLSPALLRLWKDVDLVYRSEYLFAPERLAAIWRLNIGEGTAAAQQSGYSSMLATLTYPPLNDCRPPADGPFFKF